MLRLPLVYIKPLSLSHSVPKLFPAARRSQLQSLILPRSRYIAQSRFNHAVSPQQAAPPSSLRSRLKAVWYPYIQLARLDKPIGSWLLYWPCGWSITMACFHGSLDLYTLSWNLALFGTGALVMRGAGCTINDMWDSKIDSRVERTKLRPLAAKSISLPGAWTFLAAQLSVGLAILTQLNLESILLGASSLFIVILYPLMKRITYWPQFVLGLAFNWGALLGPMAVLGYLDWSIYLPLYLGSVSWTIFYDTIYAHQDKTDDVAVGVKSTALLFGEKTKPILAGFSGLFTVGLATAGYFNEQGLPFWGLSVLGSSAHMWWQLRNVQLDSRESCWKMFRSNRDLGMLVWSGIFLDYLWQHFA